MGEISRIAAIRIAGGESEPFYSAKLRVFYWDSGTYSDQIVKDVAGLRVLLADVDAASVEHGGVDQVHLPLMLRGYVRPQAHGGGQNHGLELRLNGQGATFVGTLVAAAPTNDVTLVPIGGWPQKLGPDIEVPELRLTAGVVPVALAVDGQPLQKFLKLATKNNQSTLFGGFRLEKPATNVLSLTLVPYGIELDGSLPDPTRDLLDAPDPAARIRGRFRLERRPGQDGKPQYWLRLIGGHPDAPGAMEQLEARIARAFGDLANQKKSPLAIRFDRRPGVPPLLWPLTTTPNGLALTETVAGEFKMAIESSAIDARLRTFSDFPGDVPGIAAIHGEHLEWKKLADGFDVEISAGSSTAGAPKVVIQFARGNDAWTTSLDDTFETQPIEVSLDATAARLLAAYKSGHVVAATAARAPYAFLPITDGWLQLDLATARRETLPQPTPALPPSAMSGRIVAAHGTSADGLRGIVVDEAVRLVLTMRWRKQNAAYRPASGTLDIHGARGQLRGFVFVAETAPTAAEALPDLRRGPASTRDLPIAFNAPQIGLVLRGTFKWKPNEWALHLTDVLEAWPPDSKLEPSPGGPLGGYGWQVPHDRPFITNHPLTRTAVTPAEPSVSRGLLRYAFEGGFTLANAPDSEAPKLTVEKPQVHDVKAVSFVPDTLVLTTLPGPEFVPQKWPKEKGQFTAALRHDLSVLDELFAWADPPPPKSGAAPTPVPESESLVVTALAPARLEEVWRQNRVRMALTYTQDAFMTDWIATGADDHQDITTLVQPYRWKNVPVKIDLAPRWGAYQLNGDTYRLNTALAGLRGEFDVANGELKIGGKAITVRGNAASLFRLAGSDLVWDSRGTGLGAVASNGARPVGLDGKQRGVLRTLGHPQGIEIDGTIPWMKAARLVFHVRDLPIEGNVFDGAVNPVESAPGTVGQAFDRANFARALHEWRLIEEPKAPTATNPPKPFDLRFGPFLFRPSRLLRVELDGNEAVKLIQVIGTLRIGKRLEADGPEPGPFGADRIYERADLFCLTLKRQGNSWTPAWEGISLKHVNGPPPKLEFAPRAPEISCAVPLDVDAKQGIPSANQARIDATIVLDIANRKVRLGARLFGRDCELESEATIGAKIEFAFESAGTAAAASQVLLRIDAIAVTLAEDSQSIRIDGALQVMPEKTAAPDELDQPDKAAALVHVGREKGAFRWLDLPAADTFKRFDLSIDHASGRVGVDWYGVWTQARPLFGLEALGGWEVQARLQVFFASPEPLQKLAPLAAASAWGRIAGLAKGTTNRIDHLLRSDADSVAHHFDMTWEVGFTSPVSWPVNGLRKADGGPLPDAWRSPKDADSRKAGRSRNIRIEAGSKLTHAVKARFRRHTIDAAQLRRLAKRITPRAQIPLLVEVEHTLAGEQRSVSFTTLDHVAITSLQLMIDAGQTYGFAPRYAGRLYRGQNTQAKVPHPGLVQLPWAVSGFFDEALIRRYAAFEPHLQAPLFLGGSAALFPYRVGVEQRAVAAVVPWAGLDAKLRAAFGSLTQSNGQWEVAAPDLWGGNAQIGLPTQRTMVVASGSEAAQVLSAIGGAGLVPLAKEAALAKKAALARVMPVEQLFFENLRQGSKGQLENNADIEAAPFFLRALMAIEARWNAMPAANGKATWRALSLHPAQGDKGGTGADPVVGVEIKPSSPQAADSGNLVPADLVALSARRSASEFAYRLVQADRADDAGELAPRAELIARARDLDRFAECAIREVDREGGMPGITVVEILDPRMLRSRRGGIATDHPVLAPSPSLGWPSSVAIDGLDKLAPQLGAERPVQSAEAGFAARFRQIGLPGRTTGAMSYLGFNHRVAYQRDLHVPFEGPAARHLSPVNTRLRAPIDEALGTPADTGAILPPYFELATVGRRPGVFEVVTAAVTVAVNEKAFDPEHARFGRPATSGPVVAHQLRTPRSPALPDDMADIRIAGNESDVLKFRRRTYLSLADGSRASPTKPYILDRFSIFPESTDVLRREEKDEHLRVALSLAGVPDAPPAAAGLLGPNWDGQLAITVDAVIANIKNPAAKPDGLAALKGLIAIHTVRLEIGAASFVMKDKTAPAVAWPNFTWILSVADQLPAARDAVRRATVDVPIRLVITFGHIDPLSPAPRLKAILPLALDPGDRRVLRSRTRTVAFGDPSYDRQLGSTAEGDIKDVGGSRALLSVDREEYDPGATLYFACDTIDPVSGLFATDPKDPVPVFKVRLRRFGQPGPDGTAPAPEKLFVAGGPPAGNTGDGYELPRYAPYELPLRLLRRVGAGVDSVSPLEPGDRLEVSAELNTKMLTVIVNIIAAPVIAPPPCVYSVIESKAGAQDASRVVLHAAAPLPQHIEHPELRNDLAKGYVKRRALFVWRFASVGAEAGEIELVKYDRSGGAQLPEEA